jgi:hypothetical protein
MKEHPPMSNATDRPATRGLAAAVALMLFAGCSGSRASPPSSVPVSATTTATASASAGPSLSAADAWAADLDRLDSTVRNSHVSPFAIHSEAEWKAKLAEIRPKLATASPDEQFALVASLVGLLDTHSGIMPNGTWHPYEVLFYKFSDGWFTVAAKDKSLIGSRLISISGHPIDEVESTLRPLIPHDNEMGFLDGVEGALSYVEVLHGSGIVADSAKPQYVLERPDARRVTVDFPAVDERTWEDQFHILGDLVGRAPEAVARRGDLVWTRLDEARKVFLISVNDYGDMSAAATALTAALDSGKADRVVLDIRYLRGGNGDFGLFDIIRNDPRVNRKGGLTVLMGRENVSVATLFDYEFDVHSNALMVGEPTPARADNFRCDCLDIDLKLSGIVVTVPTDMSHNGDLRPEIPPDIAMSLRSSDFFAGRDPVLDAALGGLTAP